MKTCIYAGSFDPITNGHIDIIKRASKIFDKVIIAVGDSASKKYTFSKIERVDLIKRCVPNANVESFDGLLVDFAFSQGIKHVVRGVRNSQDFDYEKLLHEINISQKSGLDTVVLVADQSMSHISSSAVKELCKYHGDIHEYVPLVVKAELEKKLHNVCFLGITGEIASGKSTLGDSFTFNIDLDEIIDSIYRDASSASSFVFRSEIAREFGINCDLSDINKFKKDIADIVFRDEDELAWLNEFSKPYVLKALRRKISEIIKTSSNELAPINIYINSALLADLDLLYLCNNKVCLLKTTREKQLERLAARGLSKEESLSRLNSQLTTEQKIAKINSQIKKDGYGSLTIFSN